MTQTTNPNPTPATPPAPAPAYRLLPGESADILVDVADIFPNAEHAKVWLDAPNLNLGGQTPREVIGTDQEILLRDALRRIKYGLYV